MKILVTGATGFLGRRLVEMLVDAGHHVVAASRSVERETFPAGVVKRTLDIADATTLVGAFEGIDAVIHTAALVGDWGAREDFFRFDEGGTRNMIAAARAAGVQRFVHTSSIAVYGIEATGPVPEDSPRIPTTFPLAYFAAKSAAEGVVEQARADGYPVVIVRPGNIYGPRSLHWTVRPVQLMKKGLFSLPAGAGSSNTAYVDNVAALLIVAATDARAAGHTFHVVDDGLQPWAEFFGAYARAIGKKAAIRPRWFLDALATVLEMVAGITGKPPLATREAVRLVMFRGHYPMTKAERVLGWKPTVSAAEGMARTTAWLTSPAGEAATR